MRAPEALYWLSKARHAKNCGVMLRKDCDCGKLAALEALTEVAKEATLLREKAGKANVPPMDGFHQIEVTVVSGDGVRTLISLFEGDKERVSRYSPFAYQIKAPNLVDFHLKLFPAIPIEEAPSE